MSGISCSAQRGGHEPTGRSLQKQESKVSSPSPASMLTEVKPKPMCSTSEKSTSKKSTIPPQLDLEQVKIGHRNESLFAVVGHFLSQQSRTELEQFVAVGLNYARNNNERFRNPLEDNEVVGIARKSAEYYFPLAPIRTKGCDIEKQRRARYQIR